MNHPRFLRPETVSEALSFLAGYEDARPLAGGTDLVPQMRAGIMCPQVLVDLSRLLWRNIVIEEGRVTIGAGVTHRQVAKGIPELADYPALRLACASVGSAPVQNRGTIAGNLCNASPAADTAPALMVYDARVRLASAARGERTLLLPDLFCGPGQTALAPDELLTEIILPAHPPRTSATFAKMGRRQAMAIAVVSVAIRLTVDGDGTISQARIALGSVAPVPMRATDAEAVLTGQALNEATIREAARAAGGQCAPISDLRASADYRRRMVAVQTRRGLEDLCRQLQMGGGRRG